MNDYISKFVSKNHGDLLNVSIEGKITQIDTYMTDYIDQNIMITLYPYLKKYKRLFGQDLTIITSIGKIKFKVY